MSQQLGSNEYIPEHSSCDLIDYRALACIRGEIVYFEFVGEPESEELLIRLNGDLVGTIKAYVTTGVQVPKEDTYNINVTSGLGYLCPSSGSIISINDIVAC